MTRIRDELTAAPARAVLAGLLLVPVELTGLALSGTAPMASEWGALLTALFAVAGLGEACALLAVVVFARRSAARVETPPAGRGGPSSWLARLHRPILAWVVFGLADTTLDVPAALDPFLAAGSVAAAVILARAMLPAARLGRPVVLTGMVLLMGAGAMAPRGLDEFGPQRLLTHTRGPYAMAHGALRGAVQWRRERLVLALERDHPGEAHRLLADRATLTRQLDQLRALVLRTRQLHAERFGPEDLVLPPADLALAELIEGSQEGDLQDVVARLGLELSLFERTLHALETAPDASSQLREPVAQTFVFEHGAGERTFELDAHGASWIELANTGAQPLMQPRLRVDGQGGWPDLAALVEPVARRNLEPAERALALWQFLVDHWQHSEPPHSAAELHDPVKLLNVWGYGFCDDVARTYVVLARALGLRARLWALEGHVVPEAWYDGGWHMFDADGGVHYRDAAGDVLSVVALCESPDALERPVLAEGLEHPRYQVDVLRPVYASADDNRLHDVWSSGPGHAMGFVLLPGESVRWSREQGELRFADRYFRRPERLANGVWSRQLTWPEGASDCVVDFSLPYPVLAGEVRVDGALDSLSARRPGGPWVPLPTTARAERGVIASLEGFLRNGWGDPDYDLVLELRGPGLAGAHVEVELIFQHAPDVIPELGAGSHQLTLEHDGEATAVSVRVGGRSQG